MASDDRARARNRGKAFERRTAKHYGGKRNPGNHLGTADVEADWRTIENKNLAKLPALVVRWMSQAVKGAEVRKQATGQDTLPMVQMKARGQRDSSGLVVMRRKDFDDWFGNEPAEDVTAKTDMQRWAQFNRIAITADVRAKVLHIIGNQRAAFISDEAFDQVRGEIEALNHD